MVYQHDTTGFAYVKENSRPSWSKRKGFIGNRIDGKMNKQQLANKIWASANKMRSKIEANEYKDYILGFIFYKFLSDKEVLYLK